MEKALVWFYFFLINIASKVKDEVKLWNLSKFWCNLCIPCSDMFKFTCFFFYFFFELHYIWSSFPVYALKQNKYHWMICSYSLTTKWILFFHYKKKCMMVYFLCGFYLFWWMSAWMQYEFELPRIQMVR